MVVNLPTVPAKQAGWVRQLLAGSTLPHELADGVGGPVHLLHPHTFRGNAGHFQAALNDAGVDGRIFYAKKANKAACWIECCADLGIGVDVASAPELRDALAHGVRGPDLMVTGPAKAPELLDLAARHGSLLAVDSLDELDRLSGPGRIVLRCLPPGSGSRFGLSDPEIGEALRICAARRELKLDGFSFHLSGYDVAPRANLAARLIGLCHEGRRLGLRPHLVSIGGGFAVDYVEAQPWQHFLDGTPAEWFHDGKRFDGFYPYHSPVAGADMLAAILATVPAGHDDTLAALLRDAGITLALEPGRALLDQAGCSVFTVQGVKDREHGIVTVDGTSLSLSEQWFASEFVPDPVLLPQRPGTPYAASVGGASCLESDMLTWRRIVFDRRPEPGDRLVYLNTAGYQMDSNESPFHDLPLPPKIVLHDGDARPRWRFDRSPH